MGRLTDFVVIGTGAVFLSSCNKPLPPGADTSEPQAPATIATVWPATLNIVGDGFPKPGDPCRRVGESAATADVLDDSAILVGCPGSPADEPAAAIIGRGGHAVGSEQNITLISVPQGDANVGMTTGDNATGNGGPAPRRNQKNVGRSE